MSTARIRIVCPTLLALAAAAAGAQPPSRWSADEMECPGGTDLRRAEAPDGSRSALWCEASRDSQVARHGPYLELYADGTAARQGLYRLGAQAGRWVSWTPEGAVASDRTLMPGESGRHIRQPEDLCPPPSVRRRTFSYDGRHHMNSKCEVTGETGELVMVGPYVRWAEERVSGGKRYLLRSIMTYDDDGRHGPHRVFEGPFGQEVLVEEETFADGSPDGASRAYYLDGSLRETRWYSGGQFHGERVGYYPGGVERWRIVYDRGRRVETGGDLSVAGVPCPGETVPVTSADGLKEFCARRYLHFLALDGPFLERDEAGRVVESGLHKGGEKVELWQAPPGVELPVEIAGDVLVAEIQLMVGERPFLRSSTPPEDDEADLDALLEEPPAASETLDFDVWLRHLKTKKYRNPDTRVDDGILKIYGLSPPGGYYMKIEVDAEPSNDLQWPGDLTSSSELEVVPGEVFQGRAQLVYTLHLTEPWDNNEDIPDMSRGCGEEAVLPGAPRFAWRPPGEDPAGITYEYKIEVVRCDPFGRLGVAAEGTTPETAVELPLPPSERGQAYSLTLVAKRGGHAIGQLMTFGDGAYGWALRFRVE